MKGQSECFQDLIFYAVTWWWSRTDLSSYTVYSQPVKSRISLLCFTWGHTGVVLLMRLSFKNYPVISYIIISETSQAWGMSRLRIRVHAIILWVALELINLSISIIQLLEMRCVLLLGTYLPGLRSKGNCFLPSLHEGSKSVLTSDVENK